MNSKGRLVCSLCLPSLAFLSLVGTGFSFWSFFEKPETDSVPLRGNVNIAPKIEGLEFVLADIDPYYENYRLVLTQGGEGERFDASVGADFLPEIRLGYIGGMEAIEAFYQNVAYAFSFEGEGGLYDYVELVENQGGYLRDVSDYETACEKGYVALTPLFRFKNKPTTTADWAEMINAVNGKMYSLTVSLTVSF